MPVDVRSGPEGGLPEFVCSACSAEQAVELTGAARRLQRRTPPAKRVHHAIASALRVKIAMQTLPTVPPKMLNVWRSFSMAASRDRRSAWTNLGRASGPYGSTSAEAAGEIFFLSRKILLRGWERRPRIPLRSMRATVAANTPRSCPAQAGIRSP